MHGQEDDIAIIQMVLQGRQTAYATLVSRYQAYVFTITMRHVNNRELAEELELEKPLTASPAPLAGQVKFP